MADQLDLTSFIELGTSMTGAVDPDTKQRIEVACQSIGKWLTYCQYHYSNLPGVLNKGDLMLDSLSETPYRRRGESVPYRYVYEANIIGFLNCLHALLDSFPYLLSLAGPQFLDSHDRDIGWNKKFVEKYKTCPFYDSLKAFMHEKNFNLVKSYVNTTKHKHLIRIANNQATLTLEMDEFIAKVYVNDKVFRGEENIPRQNALEFISKCHDDLIP